MIVRTVFWREEDRVSSDVKTIPLSYPPERSVRPRLLKGTSSCLLSTGKNPSDGEKKDCSLPQSLAIILLLLEVHYC